MSITTDLTTTLNIARDVHLPDELGGEEALAALKLVLTLRAVADHLAAALTGVLGRSGVRETRGQSLSELLISLGCAPGVAVRLARIGAALPLLPTVADHAADGAISGEHVDAIVRGVNHIAARSPDPVGEAERVGQVTDLLGQFFSGATPAEISDRARTLGNRVAAATGGLPAAEDRTINTVTHTVTSDGRVLVRADLDAEVGAKFIAMSEDLSAPRPEPDGSPDTRSAGRRRADALEAVLDIAARGGGDLVLAPRTQLLVTIPAVAPEAARLEYIGAVSLATVDRICCDGMVTTVIIDGESVPLDMGRTKRLFPAHLRTALYLRDGGCIKCGAPAGRTQCHHIRHWLHDGETCLDNGCLLCPGCHADIHHGGWDVVMGIDRHPWLIPPATVDPRRQPLPAYNRRTMRLDSVAA